MNRFLALSSALLALTVFGLLEKPQAFSRGDGDDVIGIAPTGSDAFEFVAKTDQLDSAVTSYGYLTHVAGAEDEDLFADPKTRTEATARLTLFSTSTLDQVQPFLIGTLLTHTATGTMTFYVNDAPAGDFKNPNSFKSGQPIATYTTRLHDVLNVISPNQGLTTSVFDLEERTTTRFTFAGGEPRFGRKGLLVHVETTGQASRSMVTPLVSTDLSSGIAVINGSR
jgi:hypothetical protein